MTRFTTAVMSVVVSGAAFVSIAVQSAYAQTKPAAYVVAEVTVKDQEKYLKEFAPVRLKAVADGGGKIVVRGGIAMPIKGTPPAGRVVVIQFESLERAKAFVDSTGFKDSHEIGKKYADFRIYVLEGVAP